MRKAITLKPAAAIWLMFTMLSCNAGAYAYVHNNPVNKTDPDGRLAYHWHYLLTYKAAREEGMSRRDAMRLAWEVV